MTENSVATPDRVTTPINPAFTSLSGDGGRFESGVLKRGAMPRLCGGGAMSSVRSLNYGWGSEGCGFESRPPHQLSQG